MNWFKHDSNATQDAKLRKLIIRHGAVGYAIYFHCLELIASDVSETNLTFELEHDSEIIADNLHIRGTAEQSGIQTVEEVMRYIIELGLFESSNNHIFCFKMLKRMDTSMTSNTAFRKMITEAKEHHDEVMTGHDDVMLDKPDKQEEPDKQEGTARACESAPQEAPLPRGADPDYQVPEIKSPHFKIASEWFKYFNKKTGLTTMPDDRAMLAAKKLLEFLGGDQALALKAVDYYFENWQDLWFACDRATRKSPREARVWEFRFSSFASPENVQEILSKMKSTPSQPKGLRDPWCSAPPLPPVAPEEVRTAGANQLHEFVANLRKGKPVEVEQA